LWKKFEKLFSSLVIETTGLHLCGKPLLAELTAALDYALTPAHPFRGLHAICGMLTEYGYYA